MSDVTLDPNASLFDARRLFSSRGVWTFAFVGLAFVITVFASMMWADTGFLVDPWSWGRIATVLAAVAYGLGLGWMLYPRGLDT